MGFRFRRSLRIAPGLRINFGKRGASVSVGGRGANVTIGKEGTRTTVGLPGTGISYSHHRRHDAGNGPDGNRPSPVAVILGIVVVVLIGLAVLA